MMRRSVITGIGIVSPLGIGCDSFFSAALKGVNAIGLISKFDTARFPVRFGGEIKHWESESAALSARAEMPLITQWAVVAARKALADSGLSLEACGPVDVVTGISISSLERLQPHYDGADATGMASSTPATPISLNPANAAVHISNDLKLHGEVVNVTTACSSSTTAIGYAARLIQTGLSVCVITGGADEGITPMFLGSFGNSKLLSRRNSDPERACRPFDRLRDGQVFADAACLFVVEDFEYARKRGAQIYCEITGYGGCSDAVSPSVSFKSEEFATRAVSNAMSAAGRAGDAYDYYCALGASDPSLDIRETRLLKRIFGASARKVAVSSIKSMMGHPLGAAGAIQTAAAALAIKHRAIPPTINYEVPDPECDLDYVPNEARSQRIRNAIVYTLGNGGVNAALTLGALD